MSKHVDAAHSCRFAFSGVIRHALNALAAVWDLQDSLRACKEVKKWGENENTACCQFFFFPNDCSVVWHSRCCLLGLGPMHLGLGSSLSNAIRKSEAIVSLKWQPELGWVYLSFFGMTKKRKQERNITSQTHDPFFRWGLHREQVDPARTWMQFWLNLSPLMFGSVMWLSLSIFHGRNRKRQRLHVVQRSSFPVGKQPGLSEYLI